MKQACAGHLLTSRTWPKTQHLTNTQICILYILKWEKEVTKFYTVFERVTVVILEHEIMNDFYFCLFCLSISLKYQLLLLFSHSVVSNSLWPHGLQHARLPCPSISPRAWSKSCLLRQWCYPTILSSVAPFSSCLQPFPIRVFSNESALKCQVAKVLSLVNIYCFGIKTNFVLMKTYIFCLLGNWLETWINCQMNQQINQELPKEKIKWLLSHVGFRLKITV